MYANYTFYITEYRGSAIPDIAFDALERASCSYIDYLTHGRIVFNDLPAGVQDKVRMAVCAVAEVCFKEIKDEEQKVSSETVGNHSISYAIQNSDFSKRRAEKLMAAKMYLHGTGLLYGGMK